LGKIFWEERSGLEGEPGRACAVVSARGTRVKKGAEAAKVAWVEEHDADGGAKEVALFVCAWSLAY